MKFGGMVPTVRDIVVSAALAAGAKVLHFGHSFVSNAASTGISGGSSVVDTLSERTTGHTAWLRALDRRFNVDFWIDPSAPYKGAPAFPNNEYKVNGSAQAFAGATFYNVTDDTNTAYAGIKEYSLARNADIYWVTLGINDLRSFTAADTFTRAQTVINFFLNGGKKVVIDTIWPIGAGVAGGQFGMADNDPNLPKIGQYNTLLRNKYANGAVPGVSINDVATALGGDTRPTNMEVLQSDQLHPTDRGVYAAVTNVLPILQALVAPGSYGPSNPDPSISNLFPNASLTGTAGTFAFGQSQPISAVAAATVSSAGTGYAVNDTITLAGGTVQGTNRAVLKVTAVTSGAITAVSFNSAGLYTAIPTGTFTQFATSGAGTGATFSVVGGGFTPGSVTATGCDLATFTGSFGAHASQVTASKEASDASGFFKQVLTINPVADGNANHSLRMRFNNDLLFSAAGIADGDWYRMSVFVELSKSDFWNSFSFTLLSGTSSATKRTVTAMAPFSTGTYKMPNAALGIWVDSEPMQVVAGEGNDRFKLSNHGSIINLGWKGAATDGPLVAKIGKPILRKVADPRAAWNL